MPSDNSAVQINGAQPIHAPTRGTATRSRPRIVGGGTKRLLDLVVAATGLVMLAPLLILITLTIRATSSGPVLYGHSRIGVGGRTFRCWKFRSMVTDGDDVLNRHLAGNPDARAEWDASRKLKDDPRVTAIGQVLRDFSLDELPQLVNVLRGEMSIVGPRPVVADELERYGADSLHYLRARPGITGLWQVSGRSDLSYDHRVALDKAYVLGWSLPGDLVIMLRTIPAALTAKGAC